MDEVAAAAARTGFMDSRMRADFANGRARHGAESLRDGSTETEAVAEAQAGAARHTSDDA